MAAGWVIVPVYAGRETTQGYTIHWGSYSQRFDRKRDAVAFTKANPNGPPKTPKLIIENGKRRWSHE